MADSYVAGSVGTATTGKSVTAGAAVQVGDVLCLAAQSWYNDPGAVTDDLGNTYTMQQSSINAGGGYTYIYTAPVTVAGTPTSTATTGNARWTIAAFRGLSSATPHQKGETHANADPLTVSLTTTATCMMFALWNNFNNDRFSAWLPGGTDLSHDLGTYDRVGYLLNQAAGVFDCGADQTQASTDSSVAIVWLPTAVSGAADRGMPRGMSGGMSSFSGGMLGYRKAHRGHIFVPELPRGMGWKRGLIRGLSGGMS
jgi:hypothetical protein